MRPIPAPPRPPRSPWQLFYGAAHGLRRRWYHRRARRLSRPVVSVGNLHWGGTGKTPLVAAVAGHLRDRGLAVAVLSRGYKAKGRGVRLVSTGEGPLLGPSTAGDEPVLLAGELPGVAVVVGTDRFEAGRHALERLDPAPELFVLDDGFSHLALQRDLDLLAFPSGDPWGGGRLPPSGRLREPLTATGRADAVLLTSAEPGSGEALAAGLRQFGFGGPGFAASTRALPARLRTGEGLPKEASVLLVSAIARPERFEAAVAAQGYRIRHRLRFPDHHGYPDASLRRIEKAFRDNPCEVILTTSKDMVKLLGRLDPPLAELPIRSEPESSFWSWLDRRVDEVVATRRT